MGLSEFFSSFIPTVYAEEEVSQQEEQPVEEQPAEEQPAEEAAPEEEAATEEEEEEEEEPEDPRDAVYEECSEKCATLKKHFDECNERVENGSHENCVEEFFHFMHCADECAAPKLFAHTK